MQNFEIFYFEGFEFDQETGLTSFFYSFDKKEFFEEKIYFYDANFDFERKGGNFGESKTFLFPLFLALGISYYKLFPTKKLIVETGFLDEAQKIFWKDFYISGLGEFFYRNKLDYRAYGNFESKSQKYIQKISQKNLQNKSLLPIGGGKDSIVSSEILEQNNKNYTPFIFGKKDNIKENQLKIIQKQAIFIKRELSPNLFTLTKQGYYNGHIPISGIISFVSLFVAYLYDYKNIIFSNEKSANSGNTFLGELEVNHQYSKSLDFEGKLRNYIKSYISDEIEYFSLLRGFYEIKIASFFASFGKKYFASFSSCNTNFKINQEQKNQKLWCNACPKCVFVYSILRAFLSEQENIEIFGKELYKDEALGDLFLEIWGWKDFKPFECVGEEEEARLATYLFLEKNPDFASDIVSIFRAKISFFPKNYFENLEKKYFARNEENFIPEEFKKLLRNI